MTAKYDEIKNNLNCAINESGKQKKDIAEALGVNKSTVSKYCNGHFPGLEIFAELCEVLNVDANDILGITLDNELPDNKNNNS